MRRGILDTCRLVLLGLLCCLVSLGQAGAPQGKPTEQEALRQRARQFVLAALHAPTPEESARHRQALLDAYDALLAVLNTARTSEDIEVRVRAKDVLDRAGFAARLQRVEALLPKDLTAKFIAFRQAHPSLTADIFHRDLNRQIRGVRTIEDMSDPEGLAEPILLLCLKHPASKLRGWACAASARKQYRSDMLAKALCDIVQAEIGRERYQYYHSWGNEKENPDQPPDVLDTALDALRTIRPKQAGARLLKILDSVEIYNTFARLRLIDTIGQLDDPALIPPLIKRLSQRSNNQYTQSMNGRRIHSDQTDNALLALLRLTHQSPEEYGLILAQDENGFSIQFGFTKNSVRKKARKKFLAWWKEHKSEKRFRLAQPTSRPRSRPASQPTTHPASPPPPLAADEARQLQDDVVREAQRCVRSFSAENYRHRAAASDGLIALQHALLEAILADLPSATPKYRKRQLALSEKVILSVRAARFLYDQPEDIRRKLQKLRVQHPKPFGDYFGLSRRRRHIAFQKLTKFDPEGLTEPLVVHMLSDPGDQAREEVLKTLSTGRYRSQAVRDLLAGPISRDYLRQLKQNHTYPLHENNDPFQRWLNALGVVGGEKCFGVCKMLLEQRGWQFRYRQSFIIDAMVKCDSKRSILLLLPKLDDTAIFAQTHFNNKTISLATSDPALRALIQLTGQNPKDYSFVKYPHSSRPVYGFADEKTRKKAIAKFKTWWKANRAKSPPPKKTK